MNTMELIRTRKSVRTFDGRMVSAEDRGKLCAYIKTIRNPYDIPVEFVLLDAKEHGLSSPVIQGEELYMLLNIGQTDNKYFLAADGDVAYYFCYEKDRATTLDRPFLRMIKTKAESYVIYADQCAISDQELQKHIFLLRKYQEIS